MPHPAENRKLQPDEMGRLAPDEMPEVPKHPFVLVLDNLRSMHNVGAAFRTADAFLAEKIYLCGITATPPHREIHKTALGATDTVAWEHAPETAPLLRRLREQGYRVLLAEQTTQSRPLHGFPFEAGERYAFVFGNEVFGVDDALLPLADACLEIPQFGAKHSLNVSVSMGVVLWDYLSKARLGRG
jgi:tRNA G18 (ribose-2'-O)-methylase SpoU